jgi:thymidylate kinase
MLSSGGSVIAFIGPEATGKTTLVSEIEAWLGKSFAVGTVHVGKPPSTWVTKPINLLLPLMRILVPQLRTSRIEAHVQTIDKKQPSVKESGLSAMAYSIRSVLLAWDRQKLLEKVKYSRSNGELIICDRYPSEEVRVMDSRRLLKKTDQAGGFRGFQSLYNTLARVEEHLYRQMPPPDIVLRLSVSIETAKERNRKRIKPGKESDHYLESRHRSIGHWRRAGTKYIFDIDTENSFEETIMRVKRAIWETL